MLPTGLQRLSARDARASIGTLLFRSQCKRVARLGFRARGGCFVRDSGQRHGQREPQPLQSIPPCPCPHRRLAVHLLRTGRCPRRRHRGQPPVPPTAAVSAPAPVAPAAARPGAPGSDLPSPPRRPRGASPARWLLSAHGARARGRRGAGLVRLEEHWRLQLRRRSGLPSIFGLAVRPRRACRWGRRCRASAWAARSAASTASACPGDVAGSTGLLGYFVDVFPDPERGLHFGGALGLASGAAEVKDSGREFRAEASACKRGAATSFGLARSGRSEAYCASWAA